MALQVGRKIRSPWFDGEGTIAQECKPNHRGVDIELHTGTLVRSDESGHVVAIGDNGDGFGTRIVISLRDGSHVLLGHLRDVLVRIDDGIVPGQPVGHVGSTGNSEGPHLHFQYSKPGKSINDGYDPSVILLEDHPVFI